MPPGMHRFFVPGACLPARQKSTGNGDSLCFALVQTETCEFIGWPSAKKRGLAYSPSRPPWASKCSPQWTRRRCKCL